MTEALFVATAPVFKVDGEVKGELARDLLRLEVEEDTAGLKRLSARFIAQGPQPGEADETLLYLDGRVVDFGKSLEVSIGPADDARTIFSGTMSAIDAEFREGRQPEVLVFAEDRLMQLRLTRRSKTYRQMSDADIAGEIASQHGLSADATAEGPTYDVVQQWNQSDLAFLRERARLIQAEVWVSDKQLCFKSRGQRTATDLVLVQGNQILALSARADLAHQRTKVEVSGYDAQSRDAIVEEAGEDAIGAETSGGRNGVALAKQVFGDLPSYRVRSIAITGDEAREYARAELLRRARAFVTVAGVTRGTPDLTVGTKLSLERVGAPFEGGGYYVTRVCHTYDLAQGHRTRFEAERATVGASS
ncbi:MAG TPA: contractile injection system protein, VgrG/Pvc8 family [Gammaproteobacteria bacterium]|nr:contractile injection system protein, VgrG/Pvc8 family [Gammaproteobacteria bacterium]